MDVYLCWILVGGWTGTEAEAEAERTILRNGVGKFVVVWLVRTDDKFASFESRGVCDQVCMQRLVELLPSCTNCTCTSTRLATLPSSTKDANEQAHESQVFYGEQWHEVVSDRQTTEALTWVNWNWAVSWWNPGAIHMCRNSLMNILFTIASASWRIVDCRLLVNYCVWLKKLEQEDENTEL